MTFAIVRLTDLHLGAPWNDDPAVSLAAPVDAIRRTLANVPAAVVVSGDIARTADDAEYAQARALL